MKRNTLQLTQAYIKYLVKSKSIYAIHSPFLFSLIDHLKKAKPFPYFQNIENERKRLCNDHSEITGVDHGAGSRRSKVGKVSHIARHSLKPKKQVQTLFHIAKHFRSKRILELGTSLGISTSYFASSDEEAQVLSLEGNDVIAEKAQAVFRNLKLQNIEIIRGNIDNTLKFALKKMPDPDLVFLDANHKKAPCMNYFNEISASIHENSIVVIDDIHWSNGMEQAWEAIIQRDDVTLSVDLFHFGLLFFRDGMSKQSLIVRL
ncbi:MAG: SAM-dependent methyltransferase [Flavobacteriales bacterium]|nr:SAM-dependent methyltransferase [Flavobacteriales bacterium]